MVPQSFIALALALAFAISSQLGALNRTLAHVLSCGLWPIHFPSSHVRDSCKLASNFMIVTSIESSFKQKCNNTDIEKLFLFSSSQLIDPIKVE